MSDDGDGDDCDSVYDDVNNNDADIICAPSMMMLKMIVGQLKLVPFLKEGLRRCFRE